MEWYGKFVVRSYYEVVEPNFLLVVMVVEPKETIVEVDGETTTTVATNESPASDYKIGLMVVPCFLLSFGRQYWLYVHDAIEENDDCPPGPARAH
jgi:hypothetical protein